MLLQKMSSEMLEIVYNFMGLYKLNIHRKVMQWNVNFISIPNKFTKLLILKENFKQRLHEHR